MNKQVFYALLCMLLCNSCANNDDLIRLNVGTGFYVNKAGYLLSSNHVIAGCSRYTVYDQDSSQNATLIASDEAHDLVLLKTEKPVHSAGNFASLATSPKIADDLTTIGYPAASWEEGKVAIGKTKLISLKGPKSEDSLLQFTDSIAKGNSGGPLLDRNGNIVGLVMAKATITHMNNTNNQIISVKHHDLAVNVKTIKQFLEENEVPFQQSGSKKPFPTRKIIENAKHFVVNIRCQIEE